VDFPAVLLVDVPQRGCYSPLGHDRVSFSEERLADDECLRSLVMRFNGSPEPCTSSSHNKNVADLIVEAPVRNVYSSKLRFRRPQSAGPRRETNPTPDHYKRDAALSFPDRGQTPRFQSRRRSSIVQFFRQRFTKLLTALQKRERLREG